MTVYTYDKKAGELIDLMLDNYCVKPMTVPLAMTKAFYYEIEMEQQSKNNNVTLPLELPDDAPIVIVCHLLSMDKQLEHVCLYWKSNHYYWEESVQMAERGDPATICETIENFNIMMNGTGFNSSRLLKITNMTLLTPVAMTSSFRVPHAQTTMIH